MKKIIIQLILVSLFLITFRTLHAHSNTEKKELKYQLKMVQVQIDSLKKREADNKVNIEKIKSLTRSKIKYNPDLGVADGFCDVCKTPSPCSNEDLERARIPKNNAGNYLDWSGNCYTLYKVLEKNEDYSSEDICGGQVIQNCWKSSRDQKLSGLYDENASIERDLADLSNQIRKIRNEILKSGDYPTSKNDSSSPKDVHPNPGKSGK